MGFLRKPMASPSARGTSAEAPPNKALNRTANSSLQLAKVPLWQHTLVPRRIRSALLPAG